MNWFGWVLVVYFALEALVVIGSVGKPRTPVTPGEAVFVVVILAVLIAFVFAAVSA